MGDCAGNEADFERACFSWVCVWGLRLFLFFFFLFLFLCPLSFVLCVVVVVVVLLFFSVLLLAVPYSVCRARPTALFLAAISPFRICNNMLGAKAAAQC